MELDIVDTETSDKESAAGKISLSDIVFGAAFNEALVHQVVVAYLATARQGSRKQKNRADVAGGGKKPWRQKGTGSARAGTRSSPIWRSGGVTFAAEPQDHRQKVNKKMYRAALRCILSQLVRQQRLFVVNELAIAEPKTRQLLQLLSPLAVSRALLVVDEITQHLHLAARNVVTVQAINVASIDPVSLVNCKQLVITVAALKKLEERLG